MFCEETNEDLDTGLTAPHLLHADPKPERANAGEVLADVALSAAEPHRFDRRPIDVSYAAMVWSSREAW